MGKKEAEITMASRTKDKVKKKIAHLAANGSSKKKKSAKSENQASSALPSSSHLLSSPIANCLPKAANDFKAKLKKHLKKKNPVLAKSIHFDAECGEEDGNQVESPIEKDHQMINSTITQAKKLQCATANSHKKLKKKRKMTNECDGEDESESALKTLQPELSTEKKKRKKTKKHAEEAEAKEQMQQKKKKVAEKGENDVVAVKGKSKRKVKANENNGKSKSSSKLLETVIIPETTSIKKKKKKKTKKKQNQIHAQGAIQVENLEKAEHDVGAEKDEAVEKQPNEIVYLSNVDKVVLRSLRKLMKLNVNVLANSSAFDDTAELFQLESPSEEKPKKKQKKKCTQETQFVEQVKQKKLKTTSLQVPNGEPDSWVAGEEGEQAVAAVIENFLLNKRATNMETESPAAAVPRPKKKNKKRLNEEELSRKNEPSVAEEFNTEESAAENESPSKKKKKTKVYDENSEMTMAFMKISRMDFDASYSEEVNNTPSETLPPKQLKSKKPEKNKKNVAENPAVESPKRKKQKTTLLQNSLDDQKELNNSSDSIQWITTKITEVVEVESDDMEKRPKKKKKKIPSVDDDNFQKVQVNEKSLPAVPATTESSPKKKRAKKIPSVKCVQAVLENVPEEMQNLPPMDNLSAAIDRVARGICERSPETDQVVSSEAAVADEQKTTIPRRTLKRKAESGNQPNVDNLTVVIDKVATNTITPAKKAKVSKKKLAEEASKAEHENAEKDADTEKKPRKKKTTAVDPSVPEDDVADTEKKPRKKKTTAEDTSIPDDVAEQKFKNVYITIDRVVAGSPRKRVEEEEQEGLETSEAQKDIASTKKAPVRRERKKPSQEEMEHVEEIIESIICQYSEESPHEDADATVVKTSPKKKTKEKLKTEGVKEEIVETKSLVKKRISKKDQTAETSEVKQTAAKKKRKEVQVDNLSDAINRVALGIDDED